jgi:hypothetical protein
VKLLLLLNLPTCTLGEFKTVGRSRAGQSNREWMSRLRGNLQEAFGEGAIFIRRRHGTQHILGGGLLGIGREQRLTLHTDRRQLGRIYYDNQVAHLERAG